MHNNRRSVRSAAVVTGAGSGIGRAFALELARRGGKVVCADINRSTADETVQQIHHQGGQALAVQCDVAELQQVQALAEQAECWLCEPVSIVINNAGVGVGGRPIGEIPIEDWHYAVAINMWGVVHGCHVFVPKLKAQGRGAVINVCSAASFAAAAQMAPYNLTKAAVLALTETLSAELAGSGVSATALCPTFVKTHIVSGERISTTSAQWAQQLMDWTGVSPESVAIRTLDAMDKGQLYVLPQRDARMIWRMKRWAPVSYGKGAGWLARFAAWAEPRG